MIGGMIKGSNRIPRITSDTLDEIRHKPMAQSVPSTVAINDEKIAIIALCPMLDIHSALLNRLV